MRFMAFRIRHLLPSEAEIEQFRVVIYGFLCFSLRKCVSCARHFLHKNICEQLKRFNKQIATDHVSHESRLKRLYQYRKYRKAVKRPWWLIQEDKRDSSQSFVIYEENVRK